MRNNPLRLAAWFLLGVLFVGAPMFAFAETCTGGTCTQAANVESNYVATPRFMSVSQGVTVFGSDAAGVLEAIRVAKGGTATDPGGRNVPAAPVAGTDYQVGYVMLSGQWWVSMARYSPTCPSGGTPTNGGSPNVVHCVGGSIYSCPTGQNWTLSGSTCTRPDCPNGRKADGTCESCATLLLTNGQCAEPCTAGQQGTQFNKATTDLGANTYCGPNNCLKSVISKSPVGTSCAFGATGVGLCQTGFTVTTQSTGGYCDYGNGGTPNTKMPDADNNDSPCPAGYGSFSASGGFLRCLAPGTSDSNQQKESNEKVNTDGTPSGDKTTKVENNTSCTVAGSCTSTTVTTVTNNSNGSKTVTTETSTQSKTDFCAANPKDNNCTGVGTVKPDGTQGNGNKSNCDPTTQMCGSPGTDGLYTKKEKTFATVLTEASNRFKTSSFGSASTSFFTVTLNAGGCPAWQSNIDFMGTSVAMNLSQYFCSATADTIMALVGAVLMIVAAFVGFKWAVL